MAPVENVANSADRTMAIRLTTPPHTRETVEALAELLGRHRGSGRVSLEIELRKDSGPLRLRADLSQIRIRPSDALVTEVEQLCGKGTVSWS